MMTVTLVRPVARADYRSWRGLGEGYNAFYGRADETSLHESVTAMTWARFFDAYEPVHAVVAEHDGRLVGVAHYIYHRSTPAIEPSCYMQDLFTSENARGMGVGKALISSVYDIARSCGSSRVYWLTHRSNRAAMKLYDQVAERSGFIVYRQLFDTVGDSEEAPVR